MTLTYVQVSQRPSQSPVDKARLDKRGLRKTERRSLTATQAGDLFAKLIGQWMWYEPGGTRSILGVWIQEGEDEGGHGMV